MVACLEELQQQRGGDPELQVLLAGGLTQQGALRLWQNSFGEAEVVLDRATGLWQQLLCGPKPKREWGIAYVIACVCLEQVYEELGRPGRAEQAFGTAFRWSQELSARAPILDHPNYLHDPSLYWNFLYVDASDAEIERRLEQIRGRLARLGNGPEECSLLVEYLRAFHWYEKASKYDHERQADRRLAAALEVAAIFVRLLPRADFRPDSRYNAALHCAQLSTWLRRGKALSEALRLSEQANRALRELVHQSPETPHLLEALSQSWYEVSRILGQLNRDEEMLAARRKAVEAQRQLFMLDPAVPRYRDYLGLLYVRLGRTLCDLERLDEAEACFRERQALWPGDLAKHEEALRELRQWAAQLAGDPARLSAKEQARARRYLDLCARLERNGVARSSGIDSRLP